MRRTVLRARRALGSLLPLLFVLASLVAPATAQGEPFRRIQLKYDISLEVPLRWKIVPEATRKGLEATRRITEKAGIEDPGGRTERLLAAEAAPPPVGAMIRVNVTSPAEVSEATLAAAGPAELRALRADLFAMFRRLEASGGPRVLDLQTPRVERLKGHLVLVVPYLRAGAKGSAPWAVTQYKIPVAGRLIELTLSHRQSEAEAWRPLLDRVRSSLAF